MRHCEFVSLRLTIFFRFLSFFFFFKFDFNMYYVFSFACLLLFNTLIINNFILGSRKRYIKYFSVYHYRNCNIFNNIYFEKCMIL